MDPPVPKPRSRCLSSALVRVPRGSHRSDVSEVFSDKPCIVCSHQPGRFLICPEATVFSGDGSCPLWSEHGPGVVFGFTCVQVQKGR